MSHMAWHEFYHRGSKIGELYWGDCVQCMADMKSDYVDLIVTDPPYKIISGGDKNGKNSVRPSGILSGNRQLFTHQNDIKISSWISELYRVLKPNSHCYIFINALNMKELLVESENAGFKLHNILVWEKNNCTPSQYYMKNCEYVVFLRKGKAKYINDIGGSKTVHQFDNIIGSRSHPTQKPIDLLRFYIRNSSNPWDVVFDPFMGSGSTMAAAIYEGRRFIGYELEEKYYNIACEHVDGAIQSLGIF